MIAPPGYVKESDDHRGPRLRIVAWASVRECHPRGLGRPSRGLRALLSMGRGPVLAMKALLPTVWDRRMMESGRISWLSRVSAQVV